MGKMLKIMLAQDTDTQTGCAAALRANGFEVETVRKDGAQILRLFRQGSRPDVLIMDAFMCAMMNCLLVEGYDCVKVLPCLEVWKLPNIKGETPRTIKLNLGNVSNQKILLKPL